MPLNTQGNPVRHIEPTQNAGRAFFMRGIEGSFIMLNLLRFRNIADYSQSPELAPELAISGDEAFQKYIEHTLPFLQASGGELLFLGDGGHFLIGPETERWDKVMLVRQANVDRFMAFNAQQDYLAGIGHRIAAIEDSRLLPFTQPPSRFG